MRSNSFFSCAFTVFLWGRLAAQAPFFPLPQDEKEASIMIKEGTLDSLTWQLTKSYYEQPILVPRGELRQLVDIFPGSIPSVPLSSKDLSRYEPWKETDVQRFFHDYPELMNFAPILSFETTRRSYYARVGSSLHKYKKNDPRIVSSVMNAPAAPVLFEGRVAFDASSARWQRRAIGLKTARMGNFSLGNFSLNMDKGLFYGYFPASASDTDAALSWRYPESNAWNGIFYESPQGNHAASALFFHQRKNETVYGTRCKVGKMGPFGFLAGVSRLATAEADPGGDNFSYAHAEVNVCKDRWNAGIVAGCERSQIEAVPFLVYAKHSTKGAAPAGFEVVFARFPSGCRAVRSALLHECIEKTDKADSAAIDRSLVKTTCRIPLSPWMKSACGASYYHSIGHPAAEGFVSFSGTAWLEFALRYTFRPVIDRSPLYNCVTVSLSRAAVRSVSIRTYCRYIHKEEAYQSLFLRLFANITALPSMEIAPFAGLYGASDREREFSLGLTQTLRLFEKTWAELKVEVPVLKNFQDQWMIDAKAYFYL